MEKWFETDEYSSFEKAVKMTVEYIYSAPIIDTGSYILLSTSLMGTITPYRNNYPIDIDKCDNILIRIQNMHDISCDLIIDIYGDRINIANDIDDLVLLCNDFKNLTEEVYFQMQLIYDLRGLSLEVLSYMMKIVDFITNNNNKYS